ncbi:Splicing factor 3B subunit 3 [Panicum miliaceum]|uniref:Splicing factor 3B subunit 3 n=1 Tax=Panicum miliaceum TaxID=4540 RepID=A0A3L6RQ57_PANMI|nr:Splicing factor 3B subunit 3 [Panicum miliaceum]
MYLYSLTLQRATGAVCAVIGSFSGRDTRKSAASGSGSTQEIAVARGSTLDLLRPDPETGRLRTLLSVDVFGAILSLAQFRLTGVSKDYLVVGSDSGRLVILEYSSERNRFDKVHQETFGKSGCSRIVPGQLLAVDPKGRALCVAALEKQKLVYVLNRDAAARLTISSPLEAYKSNTLTFSLTALYCGFDNPVFAAIELEYAESDRDPTGQAANQAQKILTFYELDLGLNHVSRKASEPIDNGANLLVTVPGGSDGPSGVLVCCDNFVLYRNQGHPEVCAVIPRRADLPAERGVLIVAAATHRQKTMFFFLLQSEYGDIFKVDLEHSGDTVTELRIKYFDTIFVTSAIYVESSSATLVETEEGFQPVFFQPRALKNLMRIDDIESLMPVMDMRVANLFDEETPQLFTACGRGPRSTLRILRPGLAISEMARSMLPAEPIAVWTVKKNINGMFDAYIVVSFANVTLVLSIGETIEEVSDSQFLDTTHSLAVTLLGEDSLMQVHPNGIRHIREDGRVNEWRTPGKKTITKVGSNRLQVVIALSGGELIYFEMDMTGQLMEVEKQDMSGDVACLAIAPVPEGRQSVQSVSAAPESLLFLEVQASVGGEDGADYPANLFLNAGLQNGVLFRTNVDMCSEGVVAIAGDALRIFTIERLGETFNETDIPLRYTPRKFVILPKKKYIAVIESDKGAFSAEEREAAKKECREASGEAENGNANNGDPMENGDGQEDGAEEGNTFPDEQYGYPKAESERWVSCIRILDPRSRDTTCLLELQDNEAAVSICTVNFHDKEHGTLLAVGTAKGLQFWPKRTIAGGFIHIYKFVDEGRSLELLHKTQVEEVPLGLCQFQGRLLAGVGSVLRLYDLGKRKLLRKCENKLFQRTIVSIHTYRDRIYVGDMQESFHYCKYRRDENQLYIFADDSVPRWLTAAQHIDFDTMAGADKFGNIYFARLPQDISDEIEEDPTGGKIKEDVDFFSHLEMHLHQEHPPLCGRDHMAYRSAYFPVKDVIDGDLCEQYPSLPADMQRKIADELDRTPGEILKKLEDIRNKII